MLSMQEKEIKAISLARRSSDGFVRALFELRLNQTVGTIHLSDGKVFHCEFGRDATRPSNPMSPRILDCECATFLSGLTILQI